MEKKVDEQKEAAANYIINFYNDIQNLTHTFANYENLLIEVSYKYGADSEKIDDNEKQMIKNASHTLRYYTTVSFIKYSSIMIKTETTIKSQIIELHNKITKQFIVDREDIKKYVIELNAVLMNTVIKSLLENSTEIIGKLYKENKENA